MAEAVRYRALCPSCQVECWWESIPVGSYDSVAPSALIRVECGCGFDTREALHARMASGRLAIASYYRAGLNDPARVIIMSTVT